MKTLMPKTSSWKKAYGSWEGFVKAIHKSIGRKLGSGRISLKRKKALDKLSKQAQELDMGY